MKAHHPYPDSLSTRKYSHSYSYLLSVFFSSFLLFFFHIPILSCSRTHPFSSFLLFFHIPILSCSRTHPYALTPTLTHTTTPTPTRRCTHTNILPSINMRLCDILLTKNALCGQIILRPALPYPTLPYPTLPYPTLPYPTLPYSNLT